MLNKRYTNTITGYTSAVSILQLVAEIVMVLAAWHHQAIWLVIVLHFVRTSFEEWECRTRLTKLDQMHADEMNELDEQLARG
jgi:hypothetical protein